MCLLSLMRFFVLFPVTNKYALNSSATYHDRVVIMWWRSPPLLPLFLYFHAPSHTYREWNIEQLNYRLIMSCPHQPQKQKCQHERVSLRFWIYMIQVLSILESSTLYLACTSVSFRALQGHTRWSGILLSDPSTKNKYRKKIYTGHNTCLRKLLIREILSFPYLSHQISFLYGYKLKNLSYKEV